MPEGAALAQVQELGRSTGGPSKTGLGRIAPEQEMARIVPGVELARIASGAALALVRENRWGGSLVCFEDRRDMMLELELVTTLLG